MKAIKAMATIDAQGQLSLDDPLLLAKDSRVEVIVLIPDMDEDDESQESVLSGLRQAWKEARAGQTIPLSELWNDIDVE
ncbi:MAG: hypothetical protein HY785_11550 [Oscillatoriophycideae cyanobacterium NC_groundwater_1537_Pr4_S-0.65um_50_18]|nr:hypothetical protein [Oscillatoriophycideae cyanobacterium NC_groundwater_1537_Pr4_S-0.65um_50_18]